MNVLNVNIPVKTVIHRSFVLNVGVVIEKIIVLNVNVKMGIMIIVQTVYSVLHLLNFVKMIPSFIAAKMAIFYRKMTV